MSDPASTTRAVFLSYARDDAQAARRIAEALRSAGVEVWFDENELRGGDAWDAKIRRQIDACTLFLPIISRSTQERVKGYFRLEWKLAVDQTQMLAEGVPFVAPVVIDDTKESESTAPAEFLRVQWTRLPGALPTPEFVAQVKRLLNAPRTAGPASPTPMRAAEPAARGGTARAGGGRAPWMIGALAVAVVVAVLVWRRSDHTDQVAAPAVAAKPVETAVANGAARADDASIAVLPFVNMSDDRNNEYFSDGLSEELLNLLAKIPQLRVIARTSSFAFKGKEVEVSEIARKLNVATVLEGSVRKSGSTLRITAQLIRASDSSHLWSETYDRQLTDVFKVQDEIAGAVVAALKVKLLPSQATPGGLRRTDNTEAYNQYLLGNQYFNRNNPEGYKRALEAYRAAIALDPTFAAAYAGLSYAEGYAADYAETLEENNAGEERALATAEKAVELAPELGEGYAARGFMRATFTWEWAKAEADFRRALELDPGDSTAHRRYGNLLANLGRLEEGIVEIKKAIELDPLSSGSWSSLGLQLVYAGRLKEAREALGHALAINPDHSLANLNLGFCELMEGRAQLAADRFRRADSPWRQLGGALAEHTLGHAAEAQKSLDELIAKFSHDSAYQIAEAYAWRGEGRKAVEWLERAYVQRDAGLSQIKNDPFLASIHQEPGYVALVKKIGLAD